jgi:hypothetical protein
LKEAESSSIDAHNDSRWMSGALAWALKEAKSSSVDAHKRFISVVLDWVCKETVYFEKAARDETPRNVWRLGLGVERRDQDSLLRSGDAVG